MFLVSVLIRYGKKLNRLSGKKAFISKNWRNWMDSGYFFLGKTWKPKAFLDQRFPLLKNVESYIKWLMRRTPFAHSPIFVSNPTGKTYCRRSYGYLLPEQCIATQLVMATWTGAECLVKHQKSWDWKTLKNGHNYTWRDFTLIKKK